MPPSSNLETCPVRQVFFQPSLNPNQKVMAMKALLGHLLQFVLAYGIKDKEKFRSHVLAWLDKYELEDETREEFVEFAYAFLENIALRWETTQVVSKGVSQGVTSLEHQMEDLNDKLDKILKKMPEN
jgi:hypothetical protein